MTRKGSQFLWKKQQIAFKEVKSRLVKLPVLRLPDSKGRFHLYSDTCKFAMGVLQSTTFSHTPDKAMLG